LDTAPEAETIAADHAQRPHRSRACRIIRTPRNIFGIVRQYFAVQFPSVDPEECVSLADKSPLLTADSSFHQSRSKWWPFPNKNSFLLGSWFWTGGLQKSQSEFKNLIDIVGHPSFNSEDVRDTKWNSIFAKLGDSNPDEIDGEWLDVDAGWRKTRVDITVPFHRRMQNPGTSQFVGAELYHRSLVEVIKERICDPCNAAQIHLEPYELLWKRSDAYGEVKLHGELYTSEAFREAHHTLQQSPPEHNCDLPRVVLALMFWSDATHLTQFGSSQLWPCYMAIGNESKYRRCKPSCNLCSHVAYFQKVSKQPVQPSVFCVNSSWQLPDEFAHFATQHIGGKGPRKPFLAHCRRECFHAQVEILIDDEFLEAWRHGIVIKCFDGIFRRFYPRIFTYSADYPEKSVYAVSLCNVSCVLHNIRVLLASIKNRGRCPCPRCLIPKARMQNMGMAQDRQQRITLKRVDDHPRRFSIANARRLIYELNYAVDSKSLASFLNAESWVPTLVSYDLLFHTVAQAWTHLHPRMPFPTDSTLWGSISTKCWSSICCMSLNLACGKLFSYIYCEC
jgi:hypothetical protein